MSTRLASVVAEIDAHATNTGWDLPPHLYALVPTPELLERQPQLAEHLDPDNLDGWTPIEQEGFNEDGVTLDEALATVGWPDEVRGAALTVERTVLPSEAEAELAATGLEPGSPDFAAKAMQDPRLRDVRMTVAVLRDGTSACRIRVRSEDDDEILDGHDLVPGLVAALKATLDLDAD